MKSQMFHRAIVVSSVQYASSGLNLFIILMPYTLDKWQLNKVKDCLKDIRHRIPIFTHTGSC